MPIIDRFFERDGVLGSRTDHVRRHDMISDPGW